MRAKAKILTIGTIEEDGTVKNWSFDCHYTNANGELIAFYDNRPAIAGYTIEELKEILNNKIQ